MEYRASRARAGGRRNVDASPSVCVSRFATSLPTSSFFLRQPRMHSFLNSYSGAPHPRRGDCGSDILMKACLNPHMYKTQKRTCIYVQLF